MSLTWTIRIFVTEKSTIVLGHILPAERPQMPPYCLSNQPSLFSWVWEAIHSQRSLPANVASYQPPTTLYVWFPMHAYPPSMPLLHGSTHLEGASSIFPWFLCTWYPLRSRPHSPVSLCRALSKVLEMSCHRMYFLTQRVLLSKAGGRERR